MRVVHASELLLNTIRRDAGWVWVLCPLASVFDFDRVKAKPTSSCCCWLAGVCVCARHLAKVAHNKDRPYI